jgi:hypothetical protein
MDDTTRKLLSTTDATVWAREFVDRFVVLDDAIDEGLMISWFANAIEVGRSAGHQSCQDREAKLAEIAELHRQPAAVVGLTRALVIFEDTRHILGIQGEQND